jgi:hypothetical protein
MLSTEMSFISDSASRKTWDPDRGITLVLDKIMSDGTEFMRLIKSDSTLHFTMDTSFEGPAGESGKPLIVRRVAYPRSALAGFSIEETADIIRESLEAFKGIYGRHADEEVRVDFVNSAF